VRSVARRVEPQPELGSALRRLREEKKLSQEEVAHGADLHVTWLSHIENGRVNPAWGTVRRLAASLGVQVSDVALAAEQAPASVPAKASAKTKPAKP